MMPATKLLARLILAYFLTIGLTNFTYAQEKKIAPTTQELFNQIAYLDSLLFDAYNTQNLDKFKSLFTEDFEWFQDNGGLLSPKAIFEAVESNFKKESKLTRTLVKGSLEVHPIKDYGAIEIGSHKFSHMENGKEEIATFKFLIIWQKKDEQWKISRVISYDH
jgi:ketosteroid isomerase-like protein